MGFWSAFVFLSFCHSSCLWGNASQPVCQPPTQIQSWWRNHKEPGTVCMSPRLRHREELSCVSNTQKDRDETKLFIKSHKKCRPFETCEYTASWTYSPSYSPISLLQWVEASKILNDEVHYAKIIFIKMIQDPCSWLRNVWPIPTWLQLQGPLPVPAYKIQRNSLNKFPVNLP